MTIGSFDIQTATKEKLEAIASPLSQDDAMLILDSLDPDCVAMVEREGFTYRRVGNVAKNSAVHCTHGIKVPGASLQNDYDVAFAGFRDFKSN